MDEDEDEFISQVQEKSKNLGSLAKRIKAREIEHVFEAGKGEHLRAFRIV